MNFLAHLYLSGSSQEIKIGNFIADAVKGKELHLYPEEIRKGIILHRKIDTFTDAHPVFKSSKTRLSASHGKYSYVITDIFYDHFLATSWTDFSDVPLNNYVRDNYDILLNNFEILPDKIQYLLPKMIENNWLLNYANLNGIEKTLQGMSQRASNKNQIDKAIEDLKSDYEVYKKEFLEFFPDVVNYVKQEGIVL